MLLTISSTVLATAQEPVLIAGGSTPPTPVIGAAAYQTPQPVATPVVVGYQPTVVYVPVVAAPVVVGGAPNVIYFGGRGRCNSPGYGGYYAPGYINPPVMYFGRREVCRRGYR
jgi:hypothetical protein